MRYVASTVHAFDDGMIGRLREMMPDGAIKEVHKYKRMRPLGGLASANAAASAPTTTNVSEAVAAAWREEAAKAQADAQELAGETRETTRRVGVDISGLLEIHRPIDTVL